MTELYPWLENYRAALLAQVEQNRLPHALLITGRAGLGKQALARQLAELLLCQQRTPDGRPCGQCPACLQLAAGTHPDFLQVSPEEEATAIKVDQVRALSEALGLCAHGQGHKVAIVEPADAMNINAANSLLKTLEEPSDNTVLVLVSDRPGQLPATIRSRCQQMRVSAPDTALAMAWLAQHLPDVQQAESCLQLAAGAPLAALALVREGKVELRRTRLEQLVEIMEHRTPALAVAADWSADEGLQAIRWLREWLMDMLRIRMTGQQQAARDSDLAIILAGLAGKVDSRVLFEQLDRVNRALVQGAASLNRQLVTEDILLAWADPHGTAVVGNNRG